jgi:Leucine-rich repeat (LRR) protein
LGKFLSLRFDQTRGFEGLYGGRFSKMRRLRTLFFKHPIKFIHKDAFQGLSALKTLTLSNTEVLGLDPELLHPLRNLLDFTMPHGKLIELPKNLLKNSRSLQRISIIDHALKSVDGLLDGLKSLNVIDFKNNFLTNFTIPEVHQVVVQNNNLKILNFQGKVRKVLARNNYIERLTCPTPGQIKVNFLDLHNNSLANLDCIKEMTDLKDLDLSHNKLKSISTEDFANLTKLQTLDIRCNRIKQLSITSFYPLPELESLKLDSLVDLTIVPEKFTSIYYIYLTSKSWSPMYVRYLKNTLKKRTIFLKFLSSCDKINLANSNLFYLRDS